MTDPADHLGICQWFHHGADHDLEHAASLLHELGVRHVRTGISWADWHRPDGPAFVKRQFEVLADFQLLVSVWHTPPSIAEGGTCNSPPRRLRDYADFVDTVLQAHGGDIDALELWNEPNNLYKWDFTRYDPEWRKLGAMLADAAHWAKACGMRTVLGGMMPVDPHWLRLMDRYGVLESCDVVGIHAFPEMWWNDHPNWDWHRDWHGWRKKLETIEASTRGRPVWVTETGLATWDPREGAPARHRLQATMLARAARAPAPRVYWYCLRDLDPSREAIEGFHVDENEYHLGLVTYRGERKPAFRVFQALMRGERWAPDRFGRG